MVSMPYTPLWGKDTLSWGGNSEKGFTLKGNNLAPHLSPWMQIFFPFRVDLFSEGAWRAEPANKQPARMSQKLFPLVKMAKNLSSVSSPL